MESLLNFLHFRQSEIVIQFGSHLRVIIWLSWHHQSPVRELSCLLGSQFPSGAIASMPTVAVSVTIPPLDPSARDEGEPDYDEEAQVWAAAMEHAAEVEDKETPDEYDWQISRLVSAATYAAEPDAGRVSTGRMKIT